MIKAEITRRYVRGPMAGQFITEIEEFDDLRMAQEWFHENKNRIDNHTKLVDMQVLRSPLL